MRHKENSMFEKIQNYIKNCIIYYSVIHVLMTIWFLLLMFNFGSLRYDYGEYFRNIYGIYFIVSLFLHFVFMLIHNEFKFRFICFFYTIVMLLPILFLTKLDTL